MQETKSKSKKDSAKKRVGILRGGVGAHYTTSLKRGGDIISHIFENLGDKYKVVDILIDKDHIWHLGGLPISPSDLAHRVDVVWNTTLPSYSNILESLSIPNIGVSAFSHTLENSKEMLREHMKKKGISMPRSVVLPLYQKDFDGSRERYAIKKAKEVFEKFGSPWIIKSAWADASRDRSFTPDANMAVHLAHTFNELVAGIEDGVNHEKSILVEEFIAGKVASVHSVANFRGENVYTFPLNNFFTNFSQNEKEKINALAKDLHTHIGAEHYLKLDFILTPRGKVYLLEFESTPNLKLHSHFSQACNSVGAKMHEVVEHIIEQV
ncbi:MAG: hypothetical protein WC735_00190 [Candidatus Paceibacterota bacterium]